MYTLLPSLIAIGVVDSLNPTATALQIYLLSTPKSVARSVTFIFGVFAAYLATGLLFALGLSRVVTNVLNSAGEFMYVIQFTIGVLLIIVGCKMNQSSDKQTTSKRPQVLKPINTFLLGVAVTFSDSPTSLPYIAAIEQIIKAKLDFNDFIAILILYNLVFVFPLIVLLLISLILQKKGSALINLIGQKIMKWYPKILQIILIAIGLWLVIDCIAYALNRPLLS